MTDLICAICEEPWEALATYDARNCRTWREDHPEGWDGKGACDCSYGHDISRPEAVRFLKGEGCPSCEFGARPPIVAGQTWSTGGHNALVIPWPERGGTIFSAAPHTLAIVIAVEGGHTYGLSAFEDVLTVHVEDQEGNPQDEPITILASEFRKSFRLRLDAFERQRREQLALEAAQIDTSYSDEEPIGILIRRGVL